MKGVQDADDGKGWGRLTIIKDGNDVVRHDLEEKEILCGRVNADVVINHPMVSAKHLLLNFEEETLKCTLTDLSSNGTFVDGKQMGKGQKIDLKSGSEIVIVNTTDSNRCVAIFQNFRQNPDDRHEMDGFDCCICLKVMYKSVIILPCCHSFCSSCLSSWVKCSKKCPECRSPIKLVKMNHQMNSLIEKYMVSHPHLRRSDDEKDEMDRSDDISSAVAGGCSFKPSGNNDQFQSDDASDDDDAGEDDDDDGEDELGTSANGSWPFVLQPGTGVVPARVAPVQFTPSGSMVDNFTAVTGADAATATRVLSGALSRGLGLENAVSYYFEQTEAGNVL
jgi:hypothetical protein